jgi:hypothetical protein
VQGKCARNRKPNNARTDHQNVHLSASLTSKSTAIAGGLDRSQHTKSTCFIRSKASAEVFHKFKIGQHVEYPPPLGNYVPRGMYLVTKLLCSR